MNNEAQAIIIGALLGVGIMFFFLLTLPWVLAFSRWYWVCVPIWFGHIVK